MAELGTVVPRSGGPFTFILTAFGDLHAFWGPLPSFLYSFVNVWFVRPASVAIMTLTFAEYSVRPFGRCVTSMSADTEHAWKRSVSVAALCTVPKRVSVPGPALRKRRNGSSARNSIKLQNGQACSSRVFEDFAQRRTEESLSIGSLQVVPISLYSSSDSSRSYCTFVSIVICFHLQRRLLCVTIFRRPS